ncbi:hypothetical protein VTL71DRAFT_1686 [Oculimacula yallundae]|uniref:Uncharacterized protein n=1 Tax=Oculimacula yallundae TaxID=86028 RepID=A0ABR4CCK2_9HELO
MSAPSQPKTELPSNSSTGTGYSNGSTSSTNTNQNQNGNGNPVGKKTEAEEAADRLYEERIEEEYAKREGGA